MLSITVPLSEEMWDEAKQEFVPPQKSKTLQLEHSLVAISKWESKWNKPYLSTKEFTYEETVDYIRCMTLTPNVDPQVYERLTDENIKAITKYINSPMTATTFSNRKRPVKHNSKRTTSELIYYWMVAFGIPFECQKWHLNRLLTLIQICDVENQPTKKMSNRDVLRSNAALNEARKKKLHTKG